MRDPAEIERILKTINTENLKLKQTVDLQAKMIEELRSEIKKMGRKLRIHDNHNTPPSQKNRFGHGAKGGEDDGNGDCTPRVKRTMGRRRSAGTGRKRGGQKGRNGITNKPKPTEFEEHTCIVVFGRGNDMIFGNDGDDTIRGGPGHDHLWGQNGNDTMHGGDNGDTMYGGADADTMYGGPGQDTIRGGSGNDQIWGLGGNDTIYGDAGDDMLYAGPGIDTIYGGPGTDTIESGESDTVHDDE